jgi:hypothetical protein
VISSTYIKYRVRYQQHVGCLPSRALALLQSLPSRYEEARVHYNEVYDWPVSQNAWDLALQTAVDMSSTPIAIPSHAAGQRTSTNA